MATFPYPIPAPWARRARRERSVGAAMARFVLTAVLVLILVGFAGAEVLRQAGRTEAIRDARVLAAVAGEGIVEPALTPGLLRGDPGAIARMDRAVDGALVGRSVVRVKIWDARGRVVYSDDHRLIGAVFPLSGGERVALDGGRSEAEISDLSAPENRFERTDAKLMEVYLGIRGPQGERLLFETYQRYSSVASSGRRIWTALLPILLGALGLLAVLQLPGAWSLAQRVRRSESERRALLERALDAQQEERGRIARDLHDGVVQRLAGISYRLGAARAHANGSASEPLARAVDESALETRASIRALRSLLVDIYPPSLEREGLAAALSDLMSQPDARSLVTHLDAPDDLDLPPATEALLFRVAREALRNVVAHAGARRVTVCVRQGPERVQLDVHDDGRGFDPVAARGASCGHFGLLAIEDLVGEHGGALEIDTAPGAGTTLHVEVPLP